ncbi:class I SAM-dependent methyltransferase [Acinetobacter sp. MD2(2019)]|uniref:class I SAM-dependent methyltransferase n=1 Tax=Acinetobacter sp. MD2(2019) TaxID=2605273 RepID=UPI002D1EACC6|nr:class I SAM-dependent methyltransferase [Acinetobacter sp. MD2(2019)]MEB3754549.1 class I SAM-dependent methyltransferase [Acinetobacter sp. MD2(2019)]
MHFQCWYLPECEAQVAALQSRLAELNVTIQPVMTEKINAKFLRLNPEMALVLDQEGLSLSAQGMKMQPNWLAEIPRLKRATLKTEMLARACQCNEKPKLLDATAGLGHDTLLMARFGANVTLVERHPVLFALLEDNHRRAMQDTYLAPIVANIHLIHADSAQYLQHLQQQQTDFDVVYLDPMFPQRDQNQNAIKKQAQVKKQMQLLHMLLPEHGEMDLGDHLLELAKAITKKVIVKRPRHAVYLNNAAPQHQWLGDACRFDGYFNHQELH